MKYINKIEDDDHSVDTTTDIKYNPHYIHCSSEKCDNIMRLDIDDRIRKDFVSQDCTECGSSIIHFIGASDVIATIPLIDRR
mmetsp:Transcript_51748/g.46455  ORF Transcript_51748/g.46455 Transcript_51748/m.46455 type:complete len:82 (+) Transcript_51748:512-757(+)